MPVSYAVSIGLPAPSVHMIHENPDWTAPLFAALNLEISKFVQYAALRRAGLLVPDTVAATMADGVTEAFSRFDGKLVITKHNLAGNGSGVQLFRSRNALSDYVNGADFELSVDGITLV